jgi:hypothetical protein
LLEGAPGGEKAFGVDGRASTGLTDGGVAGGTEDEAAGARPLRVGAAGGTTNAGGGAEAGGGPGTGAGSVAVTLSNRTGGGIDAARGRPVGTGGGIDVALGRPVGTGGGIDATRGRPVGTGGGIEGARGRPVGTGGGIDATLGRPDGSGSAAFGGTIDPCDDKGGRDSEAGGGEVAGAAAMGGRRDAPDITASASGARSPPLGREVGRGGGLEGMRSVAGARSAVSFATAALRPAGRDRAVSASSPPPSGSRAASGRLTLASDGRGGIELFGRGRGTPDASGRGGANTPPAPEATFRSSNSAAIAIQKIH